MLSNNRRTSAFGSWLRENRLRLDMSQNALAHASDGLLTQCDISRMESRGLVPSDAVLEKLCHIFGGTIEELHDCLESSLESLSHISVLEQRRTSFMQSMKTDEESHLYIVRDDSVLFDHEREHLYLKLLNYDKRLRIHQLFASPSPTARRSFTRMHDQLVSTSDVIERFDGYELSHHTHDSVRMPRPSALLIGNDDQRLFNFRLDETLMDGIRSMEEALDI